MRRKGWEFLKREDDTFAVFRDGRLLKENIPERWFYEQICVDYGFCGNEAIEIRRQIEESGHCRIIL